MHRHGAGLLWAWGVHAGNAHTWGARVVPLTACAALLLNSPASANRHRQGYTPGSVHMSPRLPFMPLELDCLSSRMHTSFSRLL